MELVGEEKRIRALFSELRLENESVGPRFATVWNRAELGTVARRRPFRLSLVYSMALIACVAIFSFALVIRNWRVSQNPIAQVKDDAVTPGATAIQIPTSEGREKVVKQESGINRRLRVQKLAARRQAELIARKAARDAAAISKWQSPTSALLHSPSDEVFTSLPQLDESANELKSFLPKTPQ